MFNRVRLRGDTGAILWGYREAAALKAWTIFYHRPDLRHDGRWTLTATFARVDKGHIRRRPLLFTAARAGLKGLWCWSLKPDSIQIGETQMQAILGPPEQ